MKKDNSVFNISLVIVAIIAGWGIVSPKGFGKVADSVFKGLTQYFGWFYLMVMFCFVLFVGYLAFSKYGNIVLGPDDSKPEYSTISWFAMLFSAGMGIGLVFWGVAEPLNHFMAPGRGLVPGSPEAADFAMFASFMHWGLHPWANYTIIAPVSYTHLDVYKRQAWNAGPATNKSNSSPSINSNISSTAFSLFSPI